MPAQKTDSLGDAWKRKHFDDNNKNNWMVSVGLDLSNLLTPLDKKNALTHNAEIAALNELLKTVGKEKEKQKTAAALTIGYLNEQIARLSAIVLTEDKTLQEDAAMKARGVITEVEYKQSALVYGEKHTLLQNLKDDIWLSEFVNEFY